MSMFLSAKPIFLGSSYLLAPTFFLLLRMGELLSSLCELELLNLAVSFGSIKSSIYSSALFFFRISVRLLIRDAGFSFFAPLKSLPDLIISLARSCKLCFVTISPLIRLYLWGNELDLATILSFPRRISKRWRSPSLEIAAFLPSKRCRKERECPLVIGLSCINKIITFSLISSINSTFHLDYL